MKNTLDLEQALNPDALAAHIGNKYNEWKNHREGWAEEKRELRNYLYATDTKTTTNSDNGWSNSTTTPKLTQIYDNLKANYYATVFPNSNWLRWVADDPTALDSKTVVESYIGQKVKESGFELTMEELIDDWIIYGNCFAEVEWVEDYHTDAEGVTVATYIGPRVNRISPWDIVFDPTASSFRSTPKIVRHVMTMGAVAQMVNDGQLDQGVWNKINNSRREVGSHTHFEKSEAYIADGFNSIEQYYTSGSVEFLTFYGDLYDITTGTVKSSSKITIVDRAYVVSDEPIASWLGTDPIHHVGWRKRPDNLYAMGPLDNLVGMQYRIDHLENLKADVFDFIALPMLKIRGQVEDFEIAPGERIFVGEEGDVDTLRHDATALNADMQIHVLENRMEELAGAPRQAMGIRTPGEKTAFEVQRLENASSRIFQHKTSQFEQRFVEPLVQDMLESSRRNLNTSDTVRALDSETAALYFIENVDRTTLAAKGKLYPVAARHFAERATRVQEMSSFLQVRASDETIKVHTSGKEIARILVEELNEPQLFAENIGVDEAMESQEAAQDAEAGNAERLSVAAEEGL